MEDISEAEKQRRQKYLHHDLVVSDINSRDLMLIKDRAIKDFVNTAESDNARLIIDAFMGYLTQHGFRIKREDK